MPTTQRLVLYWSSQITACLVSTSGLGPSPHSETSPGKIGRKRPLPSCSLTRYSSTRMDSGEAALVSPDLSRTQNMPF